jgi:Protein similar to CwfJ C-terminus 1
MKHIFVAEKTLEDCKWCIGSRRSSKHLMVSMGRSVYLALPGHTSMAEGHCLIVPMNHYKAGGGKKLPCYFQCSGSGIRCFFDPKDPGSGIIFFRIRIPDLFA